MIENFLSTLKAILLAEECGVGVDRYLLKGLQKNDVISQQTNNAVKSFDNNGSPPSGDMV